METFTLSSFRSPICPHSPSKISSQPLIYFSHSLRPSPSKSQPLLPPHKRGNYQSVPFTAKSQALDFSGSFFEGGLGSDDDPASPSGSGVGTALEDKPEPNCPPGLRQYETMAVLRPDMSEDERLGLTQKYEELIVAGGGMYGEAFNRGVIPLAYTIKKKNKAGETNTYFDGTYLLFTFFTKPESITPLASALNADDDVIRSSTFIIRQERNTHC